MLICTCYRPERAGTTGPSWALDRNAVDAAAGLADWLSGSQGCPQLPQLVRSLFGPSRCPSCTPARCPGQPHCRRCRPGPLRHVLSAGAAVGGIGARVDADAFAVRPNAQTVTAAAAHQLCTPRCDADRPHAPQFCRSLTRSTQLSPHCVLPGRASADRRCDMPVPIAAHDPQLRLRRRSRRSLHMSSRSSGLSAGSARTHELAASSRTGRSTHGRCSRTQTPPHASPRGQSLPFQATAAGRSSALLATHAVPQAPQLQASVWPLGQSLPFTLAGCPCTRRSRIPARTRTRVPHFPQFLGSLASGRRSARSTATARARSRRCIFRSRNAGPCRTCGRSGRSC